MLGATTLGLEPLNIKFSVVGTPNFVKMKLMCLTLAKRRRYKNKLHGEPLKTRKLMLQNFIDGVCLYVNFPIGRWPKHIIIPKLLDEYHILCKLVS